MERLIVDTGVLVSAERRGSDLRTVVEPDDDVAIAALTGAELLLGVELASGSRRAARRRFVEALLRSIPVESYDLEVAVAHASLMAEVRRAGKPRGAHDLIIAATAAARDRTLLTSDRAAFSGLPTIRVRMVS